MPETWIDNARASYDRVAVPYSHSVKGVIETLPLESTLLRLFAQRVQESGGGLVVDAGCGPGLITDYLSSFGLDISGMDLSPALLRLASSNRPDLPFVAGSVTSMPYPDDALAGLVCWFVLHHVPDEHLATVLGEFARVLAPGAYLLLGGHGGEGSHVKREGYGGHPMNVLFARRTNDTYQRLLRQVGFVTDFAVALDPDTKSPSSVIFARAASSP